MLQIVLIWLDSYHQFFLLIIIGSSWFNILQHKNTEHHSRDIILRKGYNHWEQGLFEGQSVFENNIGLLLEIEW